MNASALKRTAAGLVFVLLSALIMTTASERVYWYLGGATVDAFLAMAVFYAIPTLALLWAVGSGPSSRLHQLVLGGAIFGFVVEGVITPVIYEDGPLPLLAALFVGWHGLVSVVSFWYFARKWLLERRRRALAIGSAVLGFYWGVWSIVYVLPEAFDEFDEVYPVMDPTDFAGYALIVGVVFASAHFVIGFVWPDEFRPGKWGRRGIVALLFGYASLAVLPVVPWAPAKFALLVGGALWLLRKSREANADGPSVIAVLAGRVRLGDVAVFMIAPVVAALAYWVVWSIELSDGAVQGVFATFSGLQVLAGLVAFAWAARRSITSARAGAEESGVPVPMS